MAEDEEQKPAEPVASAAAPEAPAPVAPVPAAPPAPPNKLHEWGAAIGIMVFLAIVLWTFLSFLRNASM
jgi:3-oxoacyl-ACP reductase-like protein